MDDIHFSDNKKKKPYSSSGDRLSYDSTPPEKEGRDLYSGAQRHYSDISSDSGRSSREIPSYPGDKDRVPSYPGDTDEIPALRAGSEQRQTVNSGRTVQAPSRGTAARNTVNNGRGTVPTNRPAAQKAPHANTPQRAPQQRPSQRQGTASVKNGRAPAPSGKKPPKKKKTSVKLKVFGALAALFVIFLCGVFAYGYSALSGLSYTPIEDNNQYIEESSLLCDESVRNILFIGSDARDGLAGKRSDSMILFSIDKKHKKLKLTSFMRDSYVYIPSKGYNTKLNAAYSYGGEQLLIDTLEYNFKIKIDDFVMVDYGVFEDFINLLGGLTIEDVTESEAKYMREQVNRPKFKAGTNHVDGRTALWYCRIRYLDDDFHRTQRQRKVITSIIKTAAKRNLFELIDIVEQVLPNISTNLTKNDLISLAVGAVFKYMRYDILQQQVPAEHTWENRRINGQDVLVLNIEKNQEILKEFIYGEPKAEKE